MKPKRLEAAQLLYQELTNTHGGDFAQSFFEAHRDAIDAALAEMEAKYARKLIDNIREIAKAPS